MRCTRQLLILLFWLPVSCLAQQIPLLKTRLQSAMGTEKISMYLEISRAYAPNRPDSAVHYCNEGILFAEKTNNRHGQGLLLLELGRINTLHRHEELARRFTNEALSIFRGLREPENIASAYDQLGQIEGQQQNTGAAAQDMNLAMQFYRDSHDSSGIQETYYRLGKVSEENGEVEKALTWYLRSLIQYEHRHQKPEAYFMLLEQISNLYLKKGDNRSALRYIEEGVRNSDITTDRDTQISLLDEEGKVYEQEGQSARSLAYYKQALNEAKKFNRAEAQARSLIDIAGVLKKENSVQSLADLKKALQIADSLRNPRLEANIYAALSGVYRQEKNYKEAMIALEENHRLVDSLLGADTTREIAAIDSSYVLEGTREKIGNLQQANQKEKTELKLSIVIAITVILLVLLLGLYLRKVNRLNRELKASNQVKDTLFSIIGHDLKGPAANVAQLFTVMESEDFTDLELKGMLADLRKQTESSLELLQSLFEWGRAQLRGIQVNPEYLDTKVIIQQNIVLLAHSAAEKNITVTDHTPADARVFADPNHFDFIIRNLLSNAIKFTYPHGCIDLEAQQDGREMVYTVKDNGIGISQAQQVGFLQTNLQVSFGTRGEKGSGLGLLLIKDFIRENKGRIWLESKEGEGTTFYVSFPMAS